MSTRRTLYADVLLPLPLKGCFTYRVPYDLNDRIRAGQRAVVPFGRNKVYASLVRRVHEDPPGSFRTKYIHHLLDDEPVVTAQQFAFWDWVAAYYMCTAGDVMSAALPPAMKLAGETRITINPAARPELHTLNEKEQALMEALANKGQITLSEASKTTSLPKVLPLIKAMMEKGLVITKEELENPWRPRLVKHVRLTPAWASEDKMEELFNYAEEKAPRQLEVLMRYISQAGNIAQRPEVSQPSLTGKVQGGHAALQALVRKGVFDITEKEISYFDHLQAQEKEITLNPHQEKALAEVKRGLQDKQAVLLHGVTSSGKTALYIKLIRETLERGEQVLYLLPEIALTTQIIRKLQHHFGNRAGIYHSRFNPMERVEVWNNLLQGGVRSGGEDIRYDLVLGPRSAVFLPFRKLGLIIVDEEHESGYKQHDPAPRYHARDAAIYLASMHGAKVLLGSATPSLEVFSNAQSGKFGYAGIEKRYGDVMMPEIHVANLRHDKRGKAMKSHFSHLLFKSMEEALQAGEQVILFQNRRGFSPRLECNVCQWLPECHQCDVTLVYHKKINRLKCHYCGHTTAPPATCPSCTSPAIKMVGFGTEKIEEELPLFFPEASIARMDLDTTRSKHAWRRIIEDFEAGRTDILVGTQMVSKGLDFQNVGVVGILNADNMLNFPDFRAHERAFQLMAQVSGRAGRHKKRGKVIIQSHNPGHPIIKQVQENDYAGMYRQQIAERQEFAYPPYTRLIKVSLMHTREDYLDDAAMELTARFSKAFPGKVLGPEYPLVSRVRNQYIKNTLIKLNRSPSLPSEKQKLRDLADRFQEESKWKAIKVVFHVDPL